MRFVHVYEMKPEPDRVGAVAPRHAAYWHGLGLPGYLGGPFDDRSGGVISFEAGSREEAEALIAADPFVREQLLAESLIKGWLVDLDRSGEAVTPRRRDGLVRAHASDSRAETAIT